MHFTKMHGIGNDYVYVDGAKERIADPSGLARRISDRHFGIGSDGLILIQPSDRADFRMEMYNADGSEGRMCGNGIRCVGKYVYDHGLTKKTTLHIETLSGVKTLTLYPGADGRIAEVRVNMGVPLLRPAEIPVVIEGREETEAPVISERVSLGGMERTVTCVSMGNPHCVLFQEEDVAELKIEEIGPAIEHDPMFPERVNAEFVNVLSDTHVRMRVWERGSGETWACGTGACAVGVASILNGYTKRELTVSLLGGDLKLEWAGPKEPLFMTGGAATVFEGDFPL